MTEKTEDLPQIVTDLMAAFPRAGQGVHQALFRVARYLHAFRSEAQITALLKALSEDCGRQVPQQEIEDAVRASKSCAWNPDTLSEVTAQENEKRYGWPEPDYRRIDEIVRAGPGLYDLWECSPRRFETPTPVPVNDPSPPDWCIPAGEPNTEELIDELFGDDNPLLCVARSTGKGDFATRRRSCWRGHLSRCALLVPNPMKQWLGKTKTGKLSEHALESVGPRRFLVIEFDISRFTRDGVTLTPWAPYIDAWKADHITIADACAALSLQLAPVAPLCLCLSSGGKSLHSWFPARGKSEAFLRSFLRRACRLGADPVTFNPNQFVRMPDGTRCETGGGQTVYFFNPEVLS